MVILNKCCFYWTLESGAITIAVFEILTLIGRFVDGIEGTINFIAISKPWEIFLFVIVSLLIAAACVLLIYAVLKRITRYFLPWLGLILASIILNFIFIFISLISSSTIYIPGGFQLYYFLQNLVEIYCWIIVYSLYKIIISERVRMNQRPNQIY